MSSSDREQVSGEAEELAIAWRALQRINGGGSPQWCKRQAHDALQAIYDLRASRQERPLDWADAQSPNPDDHFGKPAAGEPLPVDWEEVGPYTYPAEDGWVELEGDLAPVDREQPEGEPLEALTRLYDVIQPRDGSMPDMATVALVAGQVYWTLHGALREQPAGLREALSDLLAAPRPSPTPGEVLIHADLLAETARPLGEMLYLASATKAEFDLRDMDMRDLKVAVARYDRARAALAASSPLPAGGLSEEEAQVLLKIAAHSTYDSGSEVGAEAIRTLRRIAGR